MHNNPSHVISVLSMASRTKKSGFIYGLLLLSSVFTADAQLVGQTQSFSHTQGFKNTQGFANSQFGNGKLNLVYVFVGVNESIN